MEFYPKQIQPHWVELDISLPVLKIDKMNCLLQTTIHQTHIGKVDKLIKGTLIPEEIVMNKIFHIRGMEVMMDKDLAELYQVQTCTLNQAANKNLKRFPAEDLIFQLTEAESKNLMFQNGTSSWGETRKLPYAFTEQGVAMLPGILNSEIAMAVNVQIMGVFTFMRQMLLETTDLRLKIEKIKDKLNHRDKNKEIVFKYPDELFEKQNAPNPPRSRIVFKPDAY